MHLLIGVKKTSWQNVDPSDKVKIKNWLDTMNSNGTHDVASRYTHVPSGNEWFVACYHKEHLPELSNTKIQQIKATLADTSVQMAITSHPSLFLANAGFIVLVE